MPNCQCMITGFLKYIDDTSKEVNMDGLDTFYYLLQNNLSKIKSNLEDHDQGRVIIKRQGFADGGFRSKNMNPVKPTKKFIENFGYRELKKLRKRKKKNFLSCLKAFPILKSVIDRLKL